jgi:hypothetical protein
MDQIDANRGDRETACDRVDAEAGRGARGRGRHWPLLRSSRGPAARVCLRGGVGRRVRCRSRSVVNGCLGAADDHRRGGGSAPGEWHRTWSHSRHRLRRQSRHGAKRSRLAGHSISVSGDETTVRGWLRNRASSQRERSSENQACPARGLLGRNSRSDVTEETLQAPGRAEEVHAD